MTIDLNCDLGEGFGVHGPGLDEQVMPLISSANVACGFHASDPGTMHRTVALAKRYGVAVGAHPSFPDLVGFGRRHMAASPDEIRDDVIYQVGALRAFCAAEGVPLVHVKPHGALYNAAAKDLPTAVAVAEAVKAVDAGLWLVCLSGSAQVEAARITGLRFVEEVFADRAYTRDGKLAPRGTPGAVIHDVGVVEERAARMAREGRVRTVDGSDLALNAATICVHGDTPDAVALLRAVRGRLERDGIRVRAFSTEDR